MTQVRAVGGVLVLAALLIFPASARADSIAIAGNAKACFGACTSASDFADGAQTTIGGGGLLLTYSSLADPLLDFAGDTVEGFFAVDGGNGGSFGTLSAKTSSVMPLGVSTAFSLLLTFINPTSDDVTFQAAIRGAVTVLAGGLSVSFDPSIITVPFTDSATNQSGTMTVIANNASLSSQGRSTLTGMVITQTPEPTTLMLLGVGFTGLVARRKKLLGKSKT